MTSALAAAAVALAIITAASMAGSFFVFSAGVMPGLDAARPAAAIETMQSINRRIQNPVFIAVFLLPPVLSAAAGALLLAAGEGAAAALFLAAGGVYLVGGLVPSFAVNIPMNDALDRTAVPADAPDAADAWSRYSGRWTAWNTVRAVASWASLLAMSLGLYLWGG